MSVPNYSNWSSWTSGAIKHDIAGADGQRWAKIQQLQQQLAAFALAQGYTANQIRNAIEALFRTFALEWFLYLIVGADDIKTAIQNDVTLAWLNIIYPAGSGVTLRTRIINRL